MGEKTIYQCRVCGKDFVLPEAVARRYKNWQPKYCLQHLPKKDGNKSPTKTTFVGHGAVLTLSDVLQRFSAGPQSGIFTDGSARPNPGPGGWGFVWVERGEVLQQKHGHLADTTNNQMELRALIEAYQCVDSSTKISVYTDSELCFNTVTKWAAGWQKRGWRRKSGPIKNLDLVRKLYELAQLKPLAELVWTRGHAGWLWNEYADALATAWTRDKL